MYSEIKRIKIMSKLAINTKIITTAFAFLMVSMTPAQVKADDLQRLAENLCQYAKTDNRASMRKKLKGARMRLKSIYPGLICGSAGSLMRVAIANDALSAAKFIVSKAGKKGLRMVEKDGKTVLEYTEGLVASGDTSKQAFVDLIKSKL